MRRIGLRWFLPFMAIILVIATFAVRTYSDQLLGTSRTPIKAPGHYADHWAPSPSLTYAAAVAILVWPAVGGWLLAAIIVELFRLPDWLASALLVIAILSSILLCWYSVGMWWDRKLGTLPRKGNDPGPVKPYFARIAFVICITVFGACIVAGLVSTNEKNEVHALAFAFWSGLFAYMLYDQLRWWKENASSQARR